MTKERLQMDDVIRRTLVRSLVIAVVLVAVLHFCAWYWSWS